MFYSVKYYVLLYERIVFYGQKRNNEVMKQTV